jgi:hypothetical protein
MFPPSSDLKRIKMVLAVVSKKWQRQLLHFPWFQFRLLHDIRRRLLVHLHADSLYLDYYNQSRMK